MIGSSHPIGLLGRILAILVFTVALEFTISALYYERESRLSLQDDEARRLAEHLVISRKLLMETPREDRRHLSVQLTTDRYEVRWDAGLKEAFHHAPQQNRMRKQIIAWEPALARPDLRVRLESPGRKSRITGAMQLPDRSWIYFGMFEVATRWDLAIGRIALAGIPLIAILAVGGLLVRHALRPLRDLAHATERIGHGEEVMVPERGTEDIRHLIRAFNVMQSRIHRLIADRTQMLAAVGHDMRTPLARLQLRLDALEDREAAEAVSGDIIEITGMIDSLLTFLAGDKDPENPVSSDIAVMAATIIDEFRDMGRDAVYDGPDHLEMRIRPKNMRRVLRNLIENALHYGNSARLSVAREDDLVLIRVEDDGPGIPDEDMQVVLQPFVRLDQARSRNTNGLGLGLAIVARAVELEQGRLTLRNRPDGLCVEIELDAARANPTGVAGG